MYQWSHYINFSFSSNHVTSKNTYIWTNAEYVDDSFRKYSPNCKQELKLTSQKSIYNLLGFRDTRNTIHSVERVIGLDRSTEKNDSMPLLHCSIVIGRCMFVKNTGIWQQFKIIFHGTKIYWLINGHIFNTKRIIRKISMKNYDLVDSNLIFLLPVILNFKKDLK